MPTTCIFSFDRPNPIYYSGELISGMVNLTTTKEKNVREVYILFEGVAEVRWSEQRTRTVNGKSQSYTVHFSAETQYAYSKTNVFGEGEYPPGNYTYTYNVPLPLQCPSSCKEKWGKVTYKVSLIIDRVLRFNNEFSHPLEVKRTLDLNLNSVWRIPIQAEEIKKFCCWPCGQGYGILTFKLPQGAYVPNQELLYSAEIDNQSSNDIEGLEVKLKKIYTFTAHSPSHKTREDSVTLIKKVHNDRVLRLSKRVINGSLTLPDVPVSTLDNCIVSVRYYLEAILETGGCHSNLEINLDLIVGTIPLIDYNAPPPIMMIAPAENQSMFAPSAPPPLEEDISTFMSNMPPVYNDAPPTFEESLKYAAK